MNPTRRRAGLALAGALALCACDGDPATPQIDATVFADVSADRLARDGLVLLDVGPSAVVFNETRASGEDWIELYNAGAVSFTLDAYGVADTDPVNGGPRVRDAVRFPPGTLIAPGEFVIIEAAVVDAGVGPMMRCLGGAVTRCYGAPWGVSSSRGEGLYLIDSRDQIVASVTHPSSAIVMDGLSWCRVPDGVGVARTCRPTPGATNAAP